MIYIYHGDHQADSRSAFSQYLSGCIDSEVLRVDSKETNPDKIVLFLQSPSLFSSQKVLAVSNFFSLPKTSQDKIIKLIDRTKNIDILLWQDKNLSAAQLKSFPQARVYTFRLPNVLYACLNSVKPKNLQIFLPLFRQVASLNLFDLFLYLLKAQLRRQLFGYSKFSPDQLKTVYLKLIELEYQHKSGKLITPKEFVLERLISTLIR